MKKVMKFFGILMMILGVLLAVLFAVYITNADSKLIEWIYDKLMQYHTTKKVEDHI